MSSATECCPTKLSACCALLIVMAILALVKAWLMLWVSAVEDEDRSLGCQQKARLHLSFTCPAFVCACGLRYSWKSLLTRLSSFTWIHLRNLSLPLKLDKWRMIQRLRFWHGWKTLRQGTGRAVHIDVRLKCCCCWNLLEKHSAVNLFDEWWPLLSKTLKHDLAGLQHWNNIVWWSIQLLMKPLLRSTTEIVDWLLDTSLSLYLSVSLAQICIISICNDIDAYIYIIYTYERLWSWFCGPWTGKMGLCYSMLHYTTHTIHSRTLTQLIQSNHLTHDGIAYPPSVVYR